MLRIFNNPPNKAPAIIEKNPNRKFAKYGRNQGWSIESATILLQYVNVEYPNTSVHEMKIAAGMLRRYLRFNRRAVQTQRAEMTKVSPSPIPWFQIPPLL